MVGDSLLELFLLALFAFIIFYITTEDPNGVSFCLKTIRFFNADGGVYRSTVGGCRVALPVLWWESGSLPSFRPVLRRLPAASSGRCKNEQ